MKKHGLTLSLWYNGGMELRMLRSIFVKSTGQLLDMHNDEHYMIFDEMLPNDEKVAIMKTVSELTAGEDREEKTIDV